AVVHHGERPTDQPDVIALPFPQKLTGVNRRSKPTVERSRAVGVERLTVVVEDLDFVPTPQADTAVGILDNSEIYIKIEIPEFLRGDDIGGKRSVAHHAVLHRPLHLNAWIECRPARGVLAIEELNRLTLLPQPIVLVGDDRNADADP